MEIFIEKNLNPYGKKTGDCVIRAIALSSGKSWESIFDELASIAKSKYEMMNSKNVYETLLKNLGYEKHKCPRNHLGKRIPLGIFIIENNVSGVFNVRKHLTCVINSIIYDSWNPYEYCINSFWTQKKQLK